MNRQVVGPVRRPHQRDGKGVCHLTDEGAHGHGPAHPHHLHHFDHVVGERLPPVVRLLAEEDHHLPLHTPGYVQLVARPGDRTDPRGIELDYWSPHLKVEMIVRVDDGEQLGIELVEKLGNCLTRRLAGVTPAFEGDQGNRILEDRAVEPLQRAHRSNLLLVPD